MTTSFEMEPAKFPLRLVLSHVLRGFVLLLFLLLLREVLLRFLGFLQVLAFLVPLSCFGSQLELVFLLGLLLEVEVVVVRQHLLRQPLHLHRQPLVVCDLPSR